MLSWSRRMDANGGISKSEQRDAEAGVVAQEGGSGSSAGGT